MKCCVLLCLLWSLVEVHSQTAPYVTFMGETLPNHAYLDLSLVGDIESGSDSNTVQCHTDLTTCCRGSNTHLGDWIPPNSEERLPLPGDVDADIVGRRLAQRVDIVRRNNGMMPVGIYRCDIPTVAVHHPTMRPVRDSVYVGLYVGGGMEEYNTCHYVL